MNRSAKRDLRARAIALVDEGLSAAKIAEQLGVTSHTIRSWTNEEYAQRRREQINARRRGTRSPPSNVHQLEPGRISADEAAARLREIPPDTRDFTARLLGDPLPGRRAIDQLQKRT